MADLEELYLELRAANDLDAKLLFNWRNMDEIILLSASQLPVAWKDHQKWFVPTDSTCLFTNVIK